MLQLLLLAVLLLGAKSQVIPQQKDAPGVVQRKKLIAGVPIHLTETQDIGSSSEDEPLQSWTSEDDPLRSWIVRLDPASNDSDVSQVGARLQGAGASHVREGHPSEGGLAMVVVQARESQLEDALKDVGGSVRYVEQDAQVYAMEQSDPPSWGLDRIDDRSGLDESYSGSGASGGSGVHVYVLDTGVRTTHEDFEGRAIPTLESLGDGVVVCDPSNTSCADDGNGHGTHCAGTVAGRSYGVAKAATIHAVQVLSASGSGTFSGILLAMDWVAVNGERPAVVSMSLGARGVYTAIEDSVDALVSSGVVVVVAAGNSNDYACSYSPAYVPSAITVGATDRWDRRASYSNYGSCLDVFAPGSSITSAWWTSDAASKTISGTSMACPHVAGAAALLLGRDPSATPADVLESLSSTATADELSSVGSGSPNLLLFTAAVDGAEPTTVMATTTGYSTAVTTATSTTTSIFGGGDSCRCQCVCQCPASPSSSAVLAASALEDADVSPSSDSGRGSTGTVTAFAGGGLAAVALIGVTSGIGYTAGRHFGGQPEEVQLQVSRE